MSATSISLYYQNSAKNSDKEYHIQIVPVATGFAVNFQFGRRGSKLQTGTKISGVSAEQARKVFDSLVHRKTIEGYEPPKGKMATVIEARAGLVPSNKTDNFRTPFPIEDLDEIPVASIEPYMNNSNYWLQLKADGQFRQIEKRADGTYAGFNKLGTLSGALNSEIVYELDRIKAKTFFVCGEHVGNIFIAYNLLRLNGKNLSTLTYEKRYRALEKLIPPSGRHVTLIPTWETPEAKREGFAALEKHRYEGGVFARRDAAYRPGNSGNHKKFKFIKSLSAIVVRIGDKGHNSAAIGLYDAQGKMVEVGHVSLNGKPTVSINSVIEVHYLYGGAGRHLVQARMKSIRSDVLAEDCTVDQIIYKAGIAA